MPTSYTSLLGLALPVTGELSGTWGDTVNDFITQYLDSAVDGTQTISGSQTSVTLSVTTNAALSQVGAGATGSAQYAIVNCTGNPASTLTITAPASSRQYLVLNSTSTSQSVVFRGAGPTSGVTLVSGERCIVAWNGSDFVKVATSVADGVTSVSGTGTVQGLTLSGTVTSTGSLTLGGSLSAVSLTSQVSGTLPVANGGTGVTSSTGSGSVVLSSSPALTTPNLGTPSAATLTNATGLPLSTGVTGTLPVANGGTGQTSYTDGQLLIGNSSGNTLTKATLSAGSGVSISNGAGAITISATGSGGTVTSVATAGTVNGITLTGGTITSSGTITLGGTLSGVSLTSQVTGTLPVGNGGTGATTLTGVLKGNGTSAFTAGTVSLTSEVAGTLPVGNGGTGATSLTANYALFGNSTSAVNASSLLQIVGSYIRPTAYADTVVAAGNTGTALTLNCTQGNVFTATLTGNATITLSSPVGSGSSTSITLILTNDGTAGRTVAWSGGSFRFPGGAASLSRTTTANATDIWVFFTPDGGTTWYGSIPMKNMTA